ncbi:MAG: M23 family metallopeptidase [Treponema sp.]|nr:M23 family metallopeptidase [Treponema sp.]
MNRLPRIENLSRRKDAIFEQFCQTLDDNEKEIVAGRDFFLEFFVYRCQKDETVIPLSSDMLILYDTIATLNGVSDSTVSMKGRDIIIPSVKGIFIAEKPQTAIEILLSREFASECENNSVIYEINGRRFFFLAGKRFSPTQRAFFFDVNFRLPLDTKVISSDYGYRMSPVYGRWKFHKGVDFAAPEGDDVFAAKRGEVKFVAKNDSVFGNYIIIAHTDGLTSVYAHLSKIFVEKGQTVSGGQIVGRVGQTGMVTGPHLHFEIRRGGEAENPMQFLK